MLSLTQFRKHLLPLFRIMADTGVVFEIAYKGKVYDLSVKKTDKKPALTRAKRAPHRLEVQAITPDQCEECGSITFNGVCMNSKCPTLSNPTV